MIEKNNVPDAILSIRSNSEFSVGDTYDSLVWYSKDQDKPTESEFNNAVTAWNTEYDAQEYARNRATAFPSIGDQLDMLFHDMTTDKGSKDGEWYKAVAKVKLDNPKPDGWKE